MAIAKIAPTASNAVANVTSFASTLSTIWNTSRILSYDKAIDRLCDKIDDFTKKGKSTDNLEYQVGLLEELKEGAEGAGKGFLNLGKGAKGAVAGLTATVAVIIAMVAALKRLVRLANEVSAIGAEIDDMAQKLQMSNSQYQQWSYVMQMCGSDMNQLQTAMNGMIQRLKSVDAGSENALQGFRKLGISVYDTNGNLRDSFDLFQEAIYKLQQLGEGTDRAVIANQIFGKSASNLAILLNTSNEQMESILKTQDALGLSMSENAIQLSASYQDALDTMKLAGQSFKSVIAELILEPLTKVVKFITKAITYIKIFVAGLFGIKDSGKNIESVGGGIGSIGENAETANTAVNKLTRSLMGFDELNVLSPPTSSSSLSTGLEDFDLGDLQLDDIKTSFDALFSNEELEKINKFRETMEKWGTRIKDIFVGVEKIILGFATRNKRLMREGFEQLFKGITGKTLPEFLADLKKTIETSPVWETIIGIATGVGKIVKGLLTGNIVDVVSGCKQIRDTIKNSKIDKESENMANAVSRNTTKQLESIKNKWQSTWQQIKDFVLGALRDIGSGGYRMLDGFSISTIPNSNVKMATGGIVDRPVNALVGEAGREAVLPLENNTGWMDTLADRILSRQDSPTKIVLTVDGRELGEATIKNINKITRSSGKLQLLV